LWLNEISLNELKSLPKVLERVEKVKETRLKSTRSATIELANFPTKFGFISHPDSDYILIPSASLADLYDPLAMPPELTKAHQKLDKVVDEAYLRGGFKDDVDRVERLFGEWGAECCKK